MTRLLAFLVLAACAQTADAPVQQGDVPGLLRNPTAPLASQVDVTAARLEGEWFVRQNAENRRLSDETFRFETDEAGAMSLAICQSFACDVYQLNGGAQGRWHVAPLTPIPGVDVDALWVFWMDTGGRTLALGDPLGRHVWIMDRQPAGGADRIRAAREILEWYGYDISQLETVE